MTTEDREDQMTDELDDGTTCVCGHAEDKHAPTGECTDEGCGCYCYDPGIDLGPEEA
jgi:hypothetical protein